MEPALPLAIIFSDMAIRDRETNKLTLVGIFQRFLGNEIPLATPRFFVTVFLTNMSGEIEQTEVALNIEDLAGKILARSVGQISSAMRVNRNDIAEIGFAMSPTTFEREGQYRAVVTVGGETLGQRIFNVSIQH